MTRTEPEWDDLDRDIAVGLEMHEAGICGSCGYPRSVCQSADNEFRFEADGPYRCHATTAMEKARERHITKDTDAPRALSWVPLLKS